MQYLYISAEDTALCWTFYNEVYRPAFSRADREHPSNWLPLMGEQVAEDRPRVRIILAYEDEILGGIVFEEHRRTRCWLITYLVVRPNVRRRGVATGLVSEMLTVVRAGPAFSMVFAEVKESASNVLAKLDFRWLPITYVQPALGGDRPAADGFSLLVHQQPNVMGTRVRAFLAEYYGSLRQIDSPHLAAMSTTLGDEQVWTQPLPASA